MRKMIIKLNNNKCIFIFLIVVILFLVNKVNASYYDEYGNCKYILDEHGDCIHLRDIDPFYVESEDLFFSINLSINDFSFNQATNELNVDIILKNLADIYQHNIGYSINLLKGDYLNEDGFILGDLDLTYSFQGSIGDLVPLQQNTHNIIVNIPENFISSNYFFEIQLFNDKFEPRGYDYSRKPIYISGNNNFLSYFTGYFRTNYGDYPAMMGWGVNKSFNPSVIIPLIENEDLNEYLSNNNVYYRAEVFRISDLFIKDTIIESPLNQVNVVYDELYGEVLKFDFTATDEMTAGPYEIVIHFFDGNQQQIVQPFTARWLIFTGDTYLRISNAKLNQFSYRKGDNFNLNFDIGGAAHYGDSLINVELIMNSVQNEQVIFSREFDLANFVDNLDTDLILQEIKINDYYFESNFITKNITLNIYSKYDSRLLDSYTFNTPPYTLSNYLSMIIIIALLIIISIYIIFKTKIYKNGNKKK